VAYRSANLFSLPLAINIRNGLERAGPVEYKICRRMLIINPKIKEEIAF
jgi:hypothetical protein